MYMLLSMRGAERGAGLCCVAALCCVVGAGDSARADTAFSTYGPPYRPIALPKTGSGSSQTSGDALPDGRIVAVTGNSVYLETARGSGAFNVVAVFDPSETGGASDPAFVRISPDGSRIAVGIGFGKPVAIVPMSSLGTPGLPRMLSPALADYYHIAHFDGAWADSSHMALTYGNFGSPSAVSLLDLSSLPASPLNPTIISGIGGASAGIAFDAAGRLFTGNGYDLGPGGSTTGTIRAFSRSVWDVNIPRSPVDFETTGTLIGDVLSASPLLFDGEGNLIVGGGDFGDFDVGYVGVAKAAAVAAALAGLGPINSADPGSLKRLTPTPDPFAFYGAAFNRGTGELCVTLTDFGTGDNTWFATAPAPWTAALLIAAAGLGRRRRHG